MSLKCLRNGHRSAILIFEKKNCKHQPFIMYYSTSLQKHELMILKGFPVTSGNIQSDGQIDGV